MKIRRIFGKSWESGFRAVSYKEKRPKENKTDVFSKLFNLWNDTQYLQQYFIKNQIALSDPKWNGITIDEAIDKVLEEAAVFELQLKNFKTGEPGFERLDLSDIFRKIHKDVYVLHVNHFYQILEKPLECTPMLRIYAIEIKGVYIVTGGMINLSDQPESYLEDAEKLKLNYVSNYFNGENIYTTVLKK